MEALAGLQVVDLSSTMTGAHVSQLLADFGATVVQIEPPGGSPLRAQPAYPFWGRGKKSVEIDLKIEADRATVRGLARRADVVLETFRPGVAERLGIGYQDLAHLNPRLVYASISGFGRQGPYAHVKGYEGVVMAKLGGFGVFNEMSARPGPAFSGVPWCSFAASQACLHGILSALFEREGSGRGQAVDTNLVQSFVSLDSVSWFFHLVCERFPDAYVPVNSYSDDGTPNSIFAYYVMAGLTADGQWLQFSQARPHLFRAFMRALGLEWMFEDPYWAGIPAFDDVERRNGLLDRMLEGVRKLTVTEWQDVFERDPDVWGEIFRRGPEVMDHPQLAFDQFPTEILDPEWGVVRQPGPLVRLTETPAQLDRPAPGLDEHRDEIRAAALAAAVDRGDGEPIPDGAEESGLPLAGVTILELAYLMAAPYGTAVLTDLGARVIKIEPFEGDPIRAMIPFPEAGGVKVMQGKESICVDLTTPEGQEIVHRIAAEADLVVQSFRVGVAERLHLDAESLRKVNPNLVYLNAPGYGIDGPCARKPAFAPCIAAAGGIGALLIGDSLPAGTDVDLAAIRQGARLLTGSTATMNAQADGFASLVVGTASLLGLLARERGLPAQQLLTTMLSSVSHALSLDIVRPSGGPVTPTADRDLWGYSARYRIYEANDGWVFLGAPYESEWAPLVKALSPYVDLTLDERFTTEDNRRHNDDALATVLAGVFKARSKTDWEDELLSADVACVAVSMESVESVMWSQHFGRAGGYIADVTHPTFDEHPRLAPLTRFSRSFTQALPGCLAGQHTDELLSELGYDDLTISTLRERHIVA